MESFVEWLDEQWSRMDDEVDRALAVEPEGRRDG
jgi:hypothetical protein